MDKKKDTIIWGYEVVIKTDTDFKKKTIRDFTESTLAAMKKELEDRYANTRFSFRHLQEGEVPEI